MKLDLTELNNRIVTELEISSDVIIPKEWYLESNILELNNLHLTGSVFRDSSDLITLKATLSGNMILPDSISLEPVNYPFSCEIEENLQENSQKLENILDITEILWQNIMLEVPLKFTLVESFDEYQGDGWKLVSEDSFQRTNNPFSELKDMMGEE